MDRPDRSRPMEVRYWTRAGLMLTDWCNASCACCYANCSPAGRQWMSVDDALKVWSDLISASPHGCRVHLTGGEAFGRFDYLLDLCRQARQAGLGPLEAIETNGFWAEEEGNVRLRLRALAQAGMERLSISADPYHQQFVPIARVRLLAEIAAQELGPDRVKVRWADWLAEGFDLAGLEAVQCQRVLTDWVDRGRDRLTGRAADGLAEHNLKSVNQFDDNACRELLLRGRHVHIAPTGEVWPATCIGIVVGNALAEPIAEIWRRLSTGWQNMPLVGSLARGGPAALLHEAKEAPVSQADQAASKCHFCYRLRRQMRQAGLWKDWLGPTETYSLPPDGLNLLCESDVQLPKGR